MITDHRAPQDASSRQGTGKTNSLARPLGWYVCWGLISLMVSPVYGQTAEVTQRVIPAAELTDLAFIRTFLEEQFILPEDPEFTHALFFDLRKPKKYKSKINTNKIPPAMFRGDTKFHLNG
ncbi:MAG: hypothetical protein OXD43_01925 [Bacteroidetes bacterium]|nr:hypothetical protein [Bacteroidota bacterium]